MRRIARGIACLALIAATGCDAKTRTFFGPPLDVSGSRTGIVGRVTADGEGVAGVTVVLSPTGRNTETNDAGVYDFVPVPPGEYVVRITGLPAAVACAATRKQAEVSANELTEVDFSCTTAGTIVGSATLDGSPFVGLQISASGPLEATAATDSAGNYSVQNLTPGEYTVTPLPPTGVACSPAAETRDLASGETQIVDFVCTALGNLVGTVTLDGDPFEGVMISAVGVSSGTTATDAAGDYAFAGIAAGAYSVFPFGLPASVACVPTGRAITVSPGQTARADFACETIPDPTGAFDIVYTPVSNSCGGPSLAPETGTLGFAGTDLELTVPHTSFPITGPYDPASFTFVGDTDWQDSTGEFGFEQPTEKRETWEVVFDLDAGQMTEFAGTVLIEVREQGSETPLCEIEYLVQGTRDS